MFKLKGIDHIVLRINDLESMMKFYTEVIGCTFERSREDLGLYQLRAGNALIDLIPVDGKMGAMGGAAPGEQARNLDHFCLQVEAFDVEAVTAHLSAHGVKAGAAQVRYGATGNGESIMLVDPENNAIELKGAVNND